MNILYFGNFCAKDLQDKKEKNSQQPFNTAQYSYEEAFCKEMCKKNKLNIVCIYQMKSSYKNKILFWKKKDKYENTSIKYLKYINFPFIKEIMFFLGTFIQILVWNIKERKTNDKRIYLNIHYVPV